jgi:type-F conjugative transfer system secretin TraK
MKKIISIITLIMITGSVFAVNNRDVSKFEFLNNQTVFIKLSLDEINKLYIKNDVISDISFPDGKIGYDYQKNGSIILTLGSEVFDTSTQVTFYLYTEDGREVTIVATPVKDIGQTIELDPLNGVSTKAAEIEANTPYHQLMAKIISSMINYGEKKKAPEGFSVVDIPIDPSKYKLQKSDLLVYPIKAFKGDKFVGITYVVKNTTKYDIHINVKQFYKEGVLAGALSIGIVPAGGIALLYQVSISNVE